MREALPPGHAQTATALSAPGDCLFSPRGYNEAESLLAESYGIANENRGKQHADTSKALDSAEAREA